MAYFTECPRCGHKPNGGWFRIYRRRDCGKYSCYKCMVNERYCKTCGSEDFEEVGEAHKA